MLRCQVIVNTSKAVTLIMGVYLLQEASNASASAGVGPSYFIFLQPSITVSQECV
jgi:hypothetical protein